MGNGTFRTGPTSQVGFQFIEGLVLIDLNGDGKIDLVASGTLGNGANGIGVCFGNGDGTFQSAISYQANDQAFGGLVVADFNGDGIPDAATTGNSGVWLFLGKGGGVFNSGVLTPTPTGDRKSVV